MVIAQPADFFKNIGKNKRVLGLDLGEKTIGLALSDTQRNIATPHSTIKRKKFSKDIIELIKVIEEHDIAGLVLGLPINMDGSEGPKCQSVRQFARNLLKEFDIAITFQDERLSTVAVTRTLLDADMSRQRRAEVVDKMAASYILQSAMDQYTV